MVIRNEAEGLLRKLPIETYCGALAPDDEEVHPRVHPCVTPTKESRATKPAATVAVHKRITDTRP